MIICMCRDIDEAQIQEAIDHGAQTPEEIFAYCNEKPGCKKCMDWMDETLYNAGIDPPD